MEMHIPKDPELRIKSGKCFDLIFDVDGDVNHDDKDHLEPLPPKRSVKANEKTHHCAKQKGKVTVRFTSKNPGEASAHTILIGD